VAFSPDGQSVASGSNDNTIKLWNAATGEQRQTLEGHSDWVNAVAFSPDGQTVASGSGDKTIKLWNAATGEQRQTLEGHSDWVNAVAFSPDGQTVASVSDDKTIKLWNAATDEQRQTLEGHSGPVRAVASHTKEGIEASPASDLQVASPISLADQWVYMKGEKVLWLPFEYSQFSCLSTKEGALALGYPSGRVLILQLLAPN
jgi:WD40 repeat protein